MKGMSWGKEHEEEYQRKRIKNTQESNKRMVEIRNKEASESERAKKKKSRGCNCVHGNSQQKDRTKKHTSSSNA